MISRTLSVLFTVATIPLFGTVVRADASTEIKTAKNQSVALVNLVNPSRDCSANPGQVPVLRLREKPSHGGVSLQIAMADVAATDACPARKIPSIALIYTPNKDFVGKDSVQVEFDAAKIPDASFLITVQETN